MERFFAAISAAVVCASPVYAQSVVDKIESLATNQGLYGNTIPARSFPRAFTEVCIVNGAVLSDQNEANGSTAGGNCQPGEIGWVIEREERVAASWTDAKMACTRANMRLPELFEWQYSCLNAEAFGLFDMVGAGSEWGSNTPVAMSWGEGTFFGTAVPTYGMRSCVDGTWGEAAGSNDRVVALEFRCAR